MLQNKNQILDFPEQTQIILDALGNPVRRQLLTLISEQPQNVAQLARGFPISRPAISRHLAQLTAAGLVQHQSQGTKNIYELSPDGLQTTREWLNGFWDNAEFRLRLLAQNTSKTTGANSND